MSMLKQNIEEKRLEFEKYADHLKQNNKVTNVQLEIDNNNFYLMCDKEVHGQIKTYIYDSEKELFLITYYGPYGEREIEDSFTIPSEDLHNCLLDNFLENKVILMVNSLPSGSILWSGENVLGIKDRTLNREKYNNCKACRINKTIDFELVNENE